LNFFDIFPEKPSQIKFDTIIPSSSGRAVPCGWTGTMKLNLFSLCWESAYKCAIFPPFSGMSSYRSVRHADNSLSLLTFFKAKQKKGQVTYHVTLWCVRVTTFAAETLQCVLCVLVS